MLLIAGGKTTSLYENFADCSQKQFAIKPSLNRFSLFCTEFSPKDRFQPFENKFHLPSHTVQFQYLIYRNRFWQRASNQYIFAVYLLQIRDFSSIFFELDVLICLWLFSISFLFLPSAQIRTG